jgi:hypothetical protein
MPSSRVFAAAFGAEQPVASNTSEKGRALNRRVEMAPVPRTARWSSSIARCPAGLRMPVRSTRTTWCCSRWT